MKRILNFVLMAALSYGFCQFVVACSDDDEKKEDTPQKAHPDEVTTKLSDDETTLALLLKNWCGINEADLEAGFMSQTFEPKIGRVVDESKPQERTIVVGTLEKADAYALTVFGHLGLNAKQPDGFSYENEAIGKVSYSHGNGNELGVIDISIKQIPKLTKLRLTANADGNASWDEPYYHRGDIVKYDGRYWLCVSDHGQYDLSRWISFDSQPSLAGKRHTGTINWYGVGEDVFYDTPQASSVTLTDWLVNFVFDNNQWQEVMTHLEENGITDEALQSQLVPEQPYSFVSDVVVSPASVVFDAWRVLEDQNALRILGTDWAYDRSTMQDNKQSGMSLSDIFNMDMSKQNNPVVTKMVYYPKGLLLSDYVRLKTEFLSYDVSCWQPYLAIVNSYEKDYFEHLIDQASSQNARGYFAASPMALNVHFTGDPMTYNIYLVALYWTHDLTTGMPGGSYGCGLLNFADYSRYNWTGGWEPKHNYTSLEVVCPDFGDRSGMFTEVYIAGNK